MKQKLVSRRTVLKGGGAAVAALTVTQVAGPAQAFPLHAGQDEQLAWKDDQDDSSEALRHSDGQVLPWLDQPAPNPIPGGVGNLLTWEELDSFHTPTDDFFFVNHYGQPAGLDETTWRVDVGGLVRRPQSLTLADIKARARHEVDFTLECSGNNGIGLDFFIGGIGNARWGGARLAPLLHASGVLDEASEVVFWGADRGTVTIRDNSGIVGGGQTGVGRARRRMADLDLTITEQFARSMSVRTRSAAITSLLRDERRPSAARARLPGAAHRPGLVWGRQREVADAHRGDGPAAMRAASWRATTSPSGRSSEAARRSGRSPQSATTG